MGTVCRGKEERGRTLENTASTSHLGGEGDGERKQRVVEERCLSNIRKFTFAVFITQLSYRIPSRV